MAQPFRRVPPHPQEVWLKVYCAVSTAGACKTPEKAEEWADSAYKAYLKRWQWRNAEGEEHTSAPPEKG